MKINVSSELKSAGRTSGRHFEEEWGPVDLGGHKLVFTMPLSIDISYVFDGEGFNTKGVLNSELLMNCTKCNSEFKQPFSVEFSERFIKATEEEAEELECYAYSGEELDLDRPVLDLIVLNAPIYGLCRLDCKGLCPECGCDLNITKCGCSAKPVNEKLAPLTELARMLKDEEEV
ncbi:MAG: DUF177 domain-containing protein [Clostridia bacterium]|nr:DUF177 domain-containing protein [Clostridia bacterium]